MKRVLIIDDHEPSRKTLVKTLTQSGYEIAGQGASRETAVALTTTTSPDIILMAVGLPDIDGIKAACNIMHAKPPPHPNHQSPRFDHRTTRDKIRCMGYLIKPLRNGTYSSHRAGNIALPRFSYNPGFALLRGQRFCRRHSVLYRRIGQCGDYIDSLTRLRYFGPQALYPGHGKISTTPIEDIDHAIANAQNILASKIDGAAEIFYQKSD